MLNSPTKIKKIAVFALLLFLSQNFNVKAEENESCESYAKSFLASAYYSPIEGQEYYATGTLEGDQRLNGNGTHGADGTPVFFGMAAAPAEYPFGTALEIPELGTFEVHDRGGAIQSCAAETPEADCLDRIDLWLGSGDAGLTSALAFGKRQVKATVYSPACGITANFQPENIFVTPTVQSTFTTELKIGDTGAAVSTLQTELKTYGYYVGEIDEKFDEETQAALIAFQIARGIISNEDDVNAGSLDAATRESLNQSIQQRTKLAQNLKTNLTQLQITPSYQNTLALGDSGEKVREAQIELTQAGHYHQEINGIFDETMEQEVLAFQIASGVLAAATSHGAGVFGPQTRQALTQALAAKEAENSQQVQDALPIAAEYGEQDSAEVRKLQNILAELGFFAEPSTGNFDTTTKASLTAFQIEQGIIPDSEAYGAGYYGSKTKIACAEALLHKRFFLAELPKNPEWQARHASKIPQFTTSLAPGDTGSQVTELQQVLKELGYFAAEPTGNFETQTTESVIKFQIAENVIPAANAEGAGYVGPKTRTALNQIIAAENIILRTLIAAN